MGEKTLVNFQVDEGRKSVWEEKAEEDGRSLSGFIRSSVERRIAEMDGEATEGGARPVNDSRLSDVIESNKRLSGQLSELSEDVAQIMKTVEQPSEDMRELAREVFTTLPEENELGQETGLIGDAWVIESDRDRDGYTTVHDGTVRSGLIEDVADFLDEPAYLIRDAIEQLRKDTSLIGETVLNGERRYYREDE
jgi:hypothetical protein